MNILIVKTTSLGDVIHALPAIEDATRAIPGITFDWVVEAPFKEIPGFHPNVKNIIPVRVRHWRQNLFTLQTWREIKNAICAIRAKKYDKVIDAQGLIKSALITSMARGPKAGFSKTCAREPLSAYCYGQTVTVNKAEHAITRIRALFAELLGYTIETSDMHYGLSAVQKIEQQKPTLVLLHGTTWPTKHWPEVYWIRLANIAHDEGYQVLVPWGNDIERARAEKISHEGHAKILPKMTLSELAVVLKSAKAVVAGDTGLGHLAAALDVPCLSLYGPTDPKRTGAWGRRVKYMTSHLPCAPCLSQTCLISDMRAPTDPPCLGELTPDMVFAQLHSLLMEPAS